MRSPLAADWRFVRDRQGRTRLQALGDKRLEVVEQWRRLATVKQSDQKDLRFEVGDLVLLPTVRGSAVTYATPGGKLVPRFGLPYRVLQVLPGGATAIVRRCVRLGGSDHTTQVHIKDCRIINRPTNPAQAEDWERQVRQLPEVTVLSDAERDTILQSFWEGVNMEAQVPPASASKRPRTSR